jgi:ribosomal protein S18 acetylase RimI-like enzyme
MTDVTVRPAEPADRAALDALNAAAWGGNLVVGHDREFDLAALPTLVAERDGAVVGSLGYEVDGDAFEVVSIYAARPGNGIGSALLAAAVDLARQRGLRRVWLVTTNDNLDALRFYQRRGMRITAVDPGAVDRSRQRKSTIPEIGFFGIPLQDELTLERVL